MNILKSSVVLVPVFSGSFSPLLLLFPLVFVVLPGFGVSPLLLIFIMSDSSVSRQGPGAPDLSRPDVALLAPKK